MEFKLDFNPEEVAQKMADALLTSTFKEMFGKAVKQEIDRINQSSWNANSVIQSTVQQFIRQSMEDILHKEYRELVKEKLKEKISGEKLEELVGEFVTRINVRSY